MEYFRGYQGGDAKSSDYSSYLTYIAFAGSLLHIVCERYCELLKLTQIAWVKLQGCVEPPNCTWPPMFPQRANS